MRAYENSLEQDIFTVMSYCRDGIFVSEECVYSAIACNQEYLAKYPDLKIQETSLEVHIRDVINRFVRTGSVDKGKSPRRPSVSEEVVGDLRRLDKIFSALRNSCGNMKLNNGSKVLI